MGFSSFWIELRNSEDFVLALLKNAPQVRSQKFGVNLLREKNRHDDSSEAAQANKELRVGETYEGGQAPTGNRAAEDARQNPAHSEPDSRMIFEVKRLQRALKNCFALLSCQPRQLRNLSRFEIKFHALAMDVL
jgi:hypothetical protein